jgi:hypothetical protein
VTAEEEADVAWIAVLLILAGALAGTLAGGLIRKLGWTVVLLIAAWQAWRAWLG